MTLEHLRRTWKMLEEEGVAAGRVEFVGIRSRQEYLNLCRRLGIALNTYPYDRGVTTCDALWKGLAVVSLEGESGVSRAGVSLLTNIGLPELIARLESEYVDIAGRLAGNLAHLAQLRSTLRERLQGSPVMDAIRFARQVEHAYREMEGGG